MRSALKLPTILWILLLFSWTFYRIFFQFSEQVDELLVKPIVWLGILILAVRFIEKRSLKSFGWTKEKLFQNLYLGWGLGALFAFEGMIANAIKYRGMVFFPVGISLFDLFRTVLLSLVTGFTEETFFRGYLFTRLSSAFNNEIVGNILSSMAFAIIHLPIAIFLLQYNLLSIVSYEIILITLGLANGFIFSKTKSVVAPTISHALWNMTVMLFR